MIINISKINFNGGGGGKPAVLQEKSVAVVANGTQLITPDNGYDGLSVVELNVALTGNSSALDFSTIGYSAELSAEVNAKFNADIAYSKGFYDIWNPSNTSASYNYNNNTKLVYAPAIDTSNVTTMYRMFEGCSNLTTVPSLNTSKVTEMGSMFTGCINLAAIPFMDTSNVTNMNGMFDVCSKITTIPSLDTSSVTSMNYMFHNCSKLTTLPQFDTSKVTDMGYMFYGCSQLTTIPFMDTHSVTNMGSMFYGCASLTTLPQFDTSKVTDMGSMFYNCSKLSSLPLLDFGKVLNVSRFFSNFSSIGTLTDLGGFKDLKIDWSDTYGLAKCPNLTYQSVMNVINNLYDFRANGDNTTTKTIKFNSNSIALLSDDDIAIGTAKGWNITA